MTYSVVYFCASYWLFVIRYLLCFYLLFILFGVRLFVLFPFSLIHCLVLFKREKNNSDPEPCSGILIPLTKEVPVVPATCSTSTSRVNKHHTADSTDFVLV